MKNQRGSLLLAVLPLAMMASGVILLGALSGRVEIQQHEKRRHEMRALNEANSALARVEARIKSSAYSSNLNDVIQGGLNTGQTLPFTNKEGNPLHVLAVFPRSEAWVSALSTGWYQLDVVSRVGGAAAHVRELVRERDPFSRFGAFVNSHPLGIAGEPKGDIHTNKTLQLFFPGGYYEDPVTAVHGFQYVVGATADNTTFAGGANGNSPSIAMPSASSIQELSSYSDGALDTLLGGKSASAYDIYVTLTGRSYDLKAVPKSGNGQTLEQQNLPIPTSGVIFIDGDIAGLQGTLDARVTIGCTGQITVTDSLQYVDSNGEPVYLNGTSPDPANNPYVPNPDYSGDAALGVIANGDILYSKNIPNNIEMDGVFFSATGRFGLPGLSFTSNGMYCAAYDASFQKGSYRRFGGLATNLRIVDTVVNGSGKVLSGFQNGNDVYDKRMKSNPPPHYLAIDRPLYNAYRIVSGGEAGVGSHENTAFSLKSVVLGQIARDKALTGG